MRQTGAHTRKRTIRKGIQLLFFGMLCVLDQLSLRNLAYEGSLRGCSMSDTAWRKRLLKAKDGFARILSRLLWAMYPTTDDGQIAWDIVDTTRFSIRSKARNEIRLHVHLDSRGLLKEVVLSDQHKAESVLHFNFRRGEIVTGDRAYSSRKQFTVLMESQTTFLIRVNRSSIRLLDARNQRIELLPLLQGKSQPFELPARVEKNSPMFRLIVSPIPETEWERVEQRRRHKQSKNRTRNPARTPAIYARWILLATTLPAEEYDIPRVLHLYCLRWKVETYFKSLKQSLDLHDFSRCSLEFAETALLLRLIAWIFTERTVHALYETILCVRTKERFSHFVYAKALLRQFRYVIDLLLPRRIPPADTRALAYLLDHMRRSLLDDPTAFRP